MGALRILVNDNIPSHGSQRGIARYFGHIVGALIERFGDDVVVCSPDPRLAGPARHIRWRRFPGSGTLRVADLLASLAARALQPDVVVSAYYGHVGTSAAQVFPIYDMIVERFPALVMAPSRRKRRMAAEKRSCARRAALVLAISQSTADDVLDCYPRLEPAKVVVTPLGVDEHFFAAGRGPLALTGRPYFLWVGNRGGYKNFARALDAFALSGLAATHDLRVISPRGATFTRSELRQLAHLGIAGNVQLATGVDDRALRDSYAGSVALLYPSLYEGFGLPILEAMACGTLVITSSRSSMPEVGWAAACYCDPYQPEDMAARLRQLSQLPADERARRISEGRAWARTFPWRRCQEQTIAAVERLL